MRAEQPQAEAVLDSIVRDALLVLDKCVAPLSWCCRVFLVVSPLLDSRLCLFRLIFSCTRSANQTSLVSRQVFYDGMWNAFARSSAWVAPQMLWACNLVRIVAVLALLPSLARDDAADITKFPARTPHTDTHPHVVDLSWTLCTLLGTMHQNVPNVQVFTTGCHGTVSRAGTAYPPARWAVRRVGAQRSILGLHRLSK